MSSSKDLPLLSKIGGILVAIGAVLLGLHALNAYEIVGIYDAVLSGLGETGTIGVLGAEAGSLLLGALLAFVGSKMADSGSAASKSKLIFIVGLVLLIVMVVLIKFGPSPG